jgi:hypothetical protein
MDQRLLFSKINTTQKDVILLTALVDQQKTMISELILYVEYLKTKLSVNKEEFDAFKKDFIAKLKESRKSS